MLADSPWNEWMDVVKTCPHFSMWWCQNLKMKVPVPAALEWDFSSLKNNLNQAISQLFYYWKSCWTPYLWAMIHTRGISDRISDVSPLSSDFKVSFVSHQTLRDNAQSLKIQSDGRASERLTKFMLLLPEWYGRQQFSSGIVAEINWNK